VEVDSIHAGRNGQEQEVAVNGRAALQAGDTPVDRPEVTHPSGLLDRALIALNDRGRLKWFVDRLVGVAIGHDEAILWRLTRSGRVILGEGTAGAPRIRDYILDHSRLIVGNYASLAGGSVIMLGGLHGLDRVTTYPHRLMMGLPGAGEDGIPEIRGDTHIGSDAWIGTGSIIMSGVTIGDGAVVATGSVVMRDVPPFAVVAGNPARPVRWRFSEEQREALLQIRWWDWPRDRVVEAVPMLASTDIDGFIAWARARANDWAGQA
jgi:acetyltransferase-like isoleucine patch superfamily enzyme